MKPQVQIIFKYLSLLLLILPVCTSFAGNNNIFLNKPQSSWLLDSPNAFVIKDKYPKAPVHLLVIPKKPVSTLMDATPALLGEMLQLAKQAAKKYNIDKSGFRLVINTNKDGGQHIYHLHMHLLGGREMLWPPG